MFVPSIRNSSTSELSPENRKALCYRIAGELGASDAKEFGDFLNGAIASNTVDGLFEFRDLMLREQRAEAERAGMYSPRVSVEGSHPEHVETRTNAEIFSDLLLGYE